MNVYPFIEAERSRSDTDEPGGGNVARACELLKVSRSAYYAHAATKAAGGSARARQDSELAERISALHERSSGTYGAPRIHADLAGEGRRHGRKRVARLMRRVGLVGTTPRRWRKTTIADPAAPDRPDLIGRDFTPNPFGLDQRWCGDITYIRTWEGWLYLLITWNQPAEWILGVGPYRWWRAGVDRLRDGVGGSEVASVGSVRAGG